MARLLKENSAEPNQTELLQIRMGRNESRGRGCADAGVRIPFAHEPEPGWEEREAKMVEEMLAELRRVNSS